jgi:hypothetical protein
MPTWKRKWDATLSSSDCDDDFEDPTLIAGDEESDDDA